MSENKLPETMKITLEFEVTIDDYEDYCSRADETPTAYGMRNLLREFAEEELRESMYNIIQTADITDENGEVI